ncbi:MAG TPA: thioredoxin domain-containing protein [Gaiellaceae bacterium]|nr:thioredoxin domain-containing protein [Gaiellaceae bacterium]
MDSITDATFAEEVLASKIPVIVDFWAPWCKPCEAIEPHLRALSEDWSGRARFARLNIDDNLATPSRYGVLSIPTVILFAGGEPRETIVGANPRSRYERAFSEWL